MAKTNTPVSENKKGAQAHRTEANKKRRAAKAAKKAKKIAEKAGERADKRLANWTMRTTTDGAWKQGTNKTPKGTKPGVKILREDIEKEREAAQKKGAFQKTEQSK